MCQSSCCCNWLVCRLTVAVPARAHSCTSSRLLTRTNTELLDDLPDVVQAPNNCHCSLRSVVLVGCRFVTLSVSLSRFYIEPIRISLWECSMFDVQMMQDKQNIHRTVVNNIDVPIMSLVSSDNRTLTMRLRNQKHSLVQQNTCASLFFICVLKYYFKIQ